MSNIQIQKTTIYLFAGLLAVILMGGYIVFGTASASSNSQVGENCNSTQSCGNVNSQPSNQQPSGGQQDGGQQASQDLQEVYIKALSSYTYDKKEVIVKSGSPVRLHFTTEGNVGCGSMLVLYGLNQKTISRNGQEGIIEFTPTQKGTYEYNCGMRMMQGGKLIVQ